jgi:hypothetical protein
VIRQSAAFAEAILRNAAAVICNLSSIFNSPGSPCNFAGNLYDEQNRMRCKAPAATQSAG